jgi:L-ascorbate metabolism protein UlaG (beta-lactamase superfamily)
MLVARVLLSILAALVAAAWGAPANAQVADRCLAVSEAPRLTQPVALKTSEVRLSFIGHSTWLIESATGVKIATDYNDYVRPPVVPDIATMNRAHTTHYSNFPDPAIKHVLKGWNTEGDGPVKHDLTYEDVRVRNVATNIRDWSGGSIPYGNSIFVFEIAGLCIGHLGHLHHTLTEQQIAQIGQLDVVMVPVDGSYTMDVTGMVEVLRALRARLILPMHYFNPYTLERFVERIRGDFPVEMSDTATIVVSQATLPSEPKVLVLPGH